MSRFYKIVVGPGTGSQTAGTTWTNMAGNQADLGAQDIELDIHVYSFDSPISQAWVRIWGPDKKQISQASDFNNATIQVYAGMQKGLPLATDQFNSGQQGLILSGTIFQAFGNWQGINQTLDFVVTSDGGATQAKPANLSFLWKKGEQLSDVVNRTLTNAYPGYKIVPKISPNLVLTQDEPGTYPTIQEFSKYVNRVSRDILKGDYQGVRITLKEKTFSVQDGGTDNVTSIAAGDMIGQATWLDANTIQFNTVLRADLSVDSTIKFPQIAEVTAITTPNSQSVGRSKNTFNGNWIIVYARHIGRVRAPEAQSWVSTFQAIPASTTGSG